MRPDKFMEAYARRLIRDRPGSSGEALRSAGTTARNIARVGLQIPTYPAENRTRKPGRRENLPHCRSIRPRIALTAPHWAVRQGLTRRKGGTFRPWAICPGKRETSWRSEREANHRYGSSWQVPALSRELAGLSAPETAFGRFRSDAVILDLRNGPVSTGLPAHSKHGLVTARHWETFGATAC
jgi:hypothetical protein